MLGAGGGVGVGGVSRGRWKVGWSKAGDGWPRTVWGIEESYTLGLRLSLHFHWTQSDELTGYRGCLCG